MAQNHILAIPGMLEEARRIREQRNLTRKPDSLFKKTALSIAKNYDPSQHAAGKNPFEHLPNTYIQILLETILNGCDASPRSPLVPVEHLEDVLLKLLNAHVTELDLSRFLMVEMLHGLGGLAQRLLSHALEKCPKLAKFACTNVTQIVIRCDGSVPTPQVQVLRFATAWSGLKRLSCKNYYCSDDTVRLLKENMPQLEVLETDLNLGPGVDRFSMTGVDHMSCMSKLHSFAVHQHLFMRDEPAPDIYAHIAGKVPNLKKLGISEINLVGGNWFLEHMADLYPEKQITIESISITNGLKKKWPKNVKVNKFVDVFGPLDDETIGNLSGISGPVNLILDTVPVLDMYKLVEEMGAKVRSLQLVTRRRFVAICPGEVDVNRILLRCPKLESFAYASGQSISNDNLAYPMTPEHFKNYRQFDTEGRPLLVDLYKMFLLGSERVEEVVIQSMQQLHMLDEVLRENPECLSQLRVLDFATDVAALSRLRTRQNVSLSIIPSVVARLVCKSLHLEKVKISFYTATGEQLAREIQDLLGFVDEIDPTIIELSDAQMRVVYAQ